MLNRTGSHQTLTKQAKTRNFLKESHDRHSVLCLLMRREPSRSLHNLLHRPDELLHGKPSELLAIHAKPEVGLWPKRALASARALTVQHAAVKRTSSPCT